MKQNPQKQINFETFKNQEMKKNIALLIIAAICLLAALFVGTASAQVKNKPVKPDTAAKVIPFTVSFPQADVSQQFQSIQFVEKKIHTIHMDGLLRDTLDAYLGQMAQILQKRFRQSFVEDSIKRVNPKK